MFVFVNTIKDDFNGIKVVPDYNKNLASIISRIKSSDKDIWVLT